MEYKNLSTAPLIEKCAEKDPLAWAEFVRRFSPLVAFAIKKAVSRYSLAKQTASEEIKDIQQNIFLALWSKNRLEEIRNRDNINYWLAVTARNATVNYLKSARKEVLAYDESLFEKLPAKESGRETTEREKTSYEIEQYRNTLSPKEKIIFKLYFEKNLDMRNISNIIGAPAGTVSSIITRMREKIKKLKDNAAN